MLPTAQILIQWPTNIHASPCAPDGGLGVPPNLSLSQGEAGVRPRNHLQKPWRQLSQASETSLEAIDHSSLADTE